MTKKSPIQKPVKQDQATPIKMERDNRSGKHVSKQKGQRELWQQIDDGLYQYENELWDDYDEDYLPNSVSNYDTKCEYICCVTICSFVHTFLNCISTRMICETMYEDFFKYFSAMT